MCIYSLWTPWCSGDEAFSKFPPPVSGDSSSGDSYVANQTVDRQVTPFLSFPNGWTWHTSLSARRYLCAIFVPSHQILWSTFIIYGFVSTRVRHHNRWTYWQVGNYFVLYCQRVRIRLPCFATSCRRSIVKYHVYHPTSYVKPGRTFIIICLYLYLPILLSCIFYTLLLYIIFTCYYLYINYCQSFPGRPILGPLQFIII